MADVKLGPESSETTLPVINWVGASPPNLPVTHILKREEAEMTDGSLHVAFFGTKREWTIDWGSLTKANLDVIEALANLKQILRFQNGWEDATWYYVYVSSWIHNPRVITYSSTTKYAASLTIREV